MPQRDLADYALQYQELPFEPVQLAYRRKLVLSRVAVHRPERVLEIGCGEAPLFRDLPGVVSVVIEPTPAFAAGARAAAAGRPEVLVVEDHAESVHVASLGGPFDMVILSCLLHEVPEPQQMLTAVRRFLTPSGVLHVNVPSARSMHRLLAVAMGLIPYPAAESETQRRMQQRTVYDAAALEAELARAGFAVRDRGGILVKPFTHAQMQRLLDDGFLTTQLLDGFDALAGLLPELGSEIWVDAGTPR